MHDSWIDVCSYRSALLGYAAFFLALTFPYWLQGEVVAPFSQAGELAAPEMRGPAHIENKKFSDEPTAYIPEIGALLHGQRSAWLALWTNQNELGRPLDHTWGFSPAYAPTWLATKVTDSPQGFITFLSLGTCFLAGLFLLLLCLELGLAPLAGLLAASSLAAAPEVMYWLTFPMFLAAWCWSAGALYAVTRLVRQRDLLGWSILAFSVYSLLMTAFHQDIVYHAYILSGYAAYLTYRYWQSNGLQAVVIYFAVVTSAVTVGGMLAIPLYFDLAYTASQSARVAPDVSFFTEVLPPLDSLFMVWRFFALSTFPEIFGNPISESYPIPFYDGLSVTPLVIFLALSGLLLRFRETWGWWLAIVVLCLPTFLHPLYVFGVQYLGFNLSRSAPMGSILLPLTIISAYGADALVRGLPVKQRSRAVILAAAATVIGLLIVVGFGLTQGLAIRWRIVVMTLVVVGLLAAQLDKSRPALLVAALLLVGTYISFPLMLRQEPSQIVTTSVFVETLRANLPPDSRYAFVSPSGLLPPNLNAALGLPSIHSYNSLSSQRYHTLIKALGGEVRTYGRWNSSIAPDYGSAVFWMSNISLILSSTKLEHQNLEYLGQSGDVYLYRVISRMGCCLQITPFADHTTHDGVQITDPRSSVAYQPVKTLDQGDLIAFKILDSHASLLILSQKFHRDWHAQVLASSGWMVARTVAVNGIFQGVLLPDGTRMVRLRFKPFVRLAWVSHIFWMFILMLLAYQALHPRAGTGPRRPRGARVVGVPVATN